MRASTLVLSALLALSLVACGGGGSDSAFCDAASQLVELSEQILDTENFEDLDIESIDAQASEIIEELEGNAPDEIADAIDSADPADEEAVTTYLSEECGVTFPEGF